MKVENRKIQATCKHSTYEKIFYKIVRGKQQDEMEVNLCM